MPHARPPFMCPLELRLLLAVDLHIADPRALNNVVGEFIPIRARFAVENLGDSATARPVAYRVVLKSKENGATLAVLGNGTVPALAAGEVSDTVTASYPAPTSLLGETYYLAYLVDPDNVIAEIDETNNDGPPGVAVHLAPTFVGTTLTGTSGDEHLRAYDYDPPYDDQVDAFILFYGTSNVGGAGPNGYQIARASDLPRLTVNLLAGNDTFSTMDGLSIGVDILCGDGNDSVFSSDGLDNIAGGNGDDCLSGGNGNDTIDGGAGNDYLRGDFDNAKVNTVGDDLLLGGDGNDILVGDGGDDVLKGGKGRDRLHGQDGNDYLAGNAHSDRLFGGDGNDTLFGHDGRDFLYGNNGSDRLVGGFGNDVMEDTYDTGSVDSFSGNSGQDTGFANAGDLLASIEIRPNG